MTRHEKRGLALRLRQLLFTAAKTLVVCSFAVWGACALHSESSAGRFNDDVENLARWSHMYSQEDLAAEVSRRAAEDGVVIDFLDVSVRDHFVFIRVNYHAHYRIGPYDRTYLYEKRAAAPAVASN